MDTANTLTSSATRFELQYSTEREEICNYLTALMSDLTAIEEEVDFFRSCVHKEVAVQNTAKFRGNCFDLRLPHFCPVIFHDGYLTHNGV